MSPAHEEQAVAALWDSGCLGVQILSSGKVGRLTLDAYYPSRAGLRRLGGRLRSSLRAAGLPDESRPQLRAFGPGRWVEAWQRTLRPMAIGDFLVVPEGRRAPARTRGRHVIRVRYGQAFGTGEHASTRLCLRLLRRYLRPGMSVADLGTGSGILAMAACRLGAGRVIAIDDDGVALAVARANLRDNRLSARVEVLRADAATTQHLGPFDFTLINIGAATIVRVLPEIASGLAPGGVLLLAGILVEDEAAIERAAAGIGLSLVERRRSKPWSALVLRRAKVKKPGGARTA